VNKVILMGRLTRDPEVRKTVNDTSVANFTLAVAKRFRQENEPDADFIRIVAWSRLADFSAHYLKKGRQVVVVGRLQVRNWEDRDNVKHSITEVVADEIYFADSKPKEETTTSVPSVTKEDVSLSDSEIEGFYEEEIDSGVNGPEDDLPF